MSDLVSKTKNTSILTTSKKSKTMGKLLVMPVNSTLMFDVNNKSLLQMGNKINLCTNWSFHIKKTKPKRN